jgi:hypothetical protein
MDNHTIIFKKDSPICRQDSQKRGWIRFHKAVQICSKSDSNGKFGNGYLDVLIKKWITAAAQ